MTYLVPVQKLVFIICLSSVMSVSCESRKQTDTADIMTVTPEPECYLYVRERDSIELSIEENTDNVKGHLSFRFFEKDKSTGTIEGEMRGDTLFVNYTFTAEGMLSSREVAFLKKDDRFFLGSGEIPNSGSSDVVKDRETIEFSDRIALKRVDCK